MLNRRYLRIKVYHALYAYWQSDDASAARIEKEMLNSIDRTHHIYLGLLATFGELRHIASLRIAERSRKHVPTSEDLNPNMRFVDGPLLRMIAENERLAAECNKHRVSWVGDQDVFTKIHREMEADEGYRAYMDDPEPSFAKEQAFLIRLFTRHIANNAVLQEVFENRSIHWMEDLDLAAGMVKRTLEQIRDDDGPQGLGLPELEREPVEEYAFATQLYRKCIEHDVEHEEAIAAKASNWESDRIAFSDMILMKMALTEVRHFDQIPVKVTLNEYIEIAKAYSTPKSKNFINGVLDKLFIEMKEDGRIRKVGRGLLEG